MLFTVSTDQYAPGDSARDAPSLQTPRQLLEYCFPKCHRCYKTDTLSNDCFFHTIEPIAAFRDTQFETRAGKKKHLQIHKTILYRLVASMFLLFWHLFDRLDAWAGYIWNDHWQNVQSLEIHVRRASVLSALRHRLLPKRHSHLWIGHFRVGDVDSVHAVFLLPGERSHRLGGPTTG